ncbi:unnamed protein product [Auanema sp. JU1783]|nr:unnamed protein product [Auanema sp. JU1783]
MKFLLFLILLQSSLFSFCLKYPNEIVDIPIVLCEPERIIIKIRTTSSNPSHIYADDFPDDHNCSARNMNKITIKHGQCGMNAETTDNPAGVIQRVCINVQLHPLFVTESDRSYCAQCVYVKSHVLDDFEQSLDISEAPPTELTPQFDVSSPPKCTYSIRKGSSTGPEVYYATIGESVFHVWKCEGENTGILVQNCHVEDGQGNRIMIIDQNGCGVDHYVMATPKYTDNLSTAFQETHVFKFASKTITRFICQIRICLQGDDCKKVSPPTACPSLDQRIEQAKRLREAPQKGIKEIFKTVDDPSTRLLNRDESVLANNAQTSDDNLNDAKNATIGSIYFGYGFNPKRQRREILIDARNSVPKSRFSMSNGYPEVDLVGELRVLENEQDVRYYEQKASPPPAECDNQSPLLIFIVALFIASLILLIVVFILLLRPSNIKNKIVKFAY